jgi:hypothetical protein
MNAPTISLDGHVKVDAHHALTVEGSNFRSGHPFRDTQTATAAAEPTSRPTTPASSPNEPASDGASTPEQATSSAAPITPPPARAQRPPVAAILPPTSTSGVPQLADPLLALAADVLDDLERVRIANENRLRQLTRSVEDSDGELRGFGLDERHPDVARLAGLVDGLAKLEHDAELGLRRQLRKHPLGPWVKSARGVGEKQAARLLAAIGDPYWNDLHDRPRLVSELWSYAGYGDAAAQVRRRGEKANWSATAKMRAYLVAVSIVKAGGSYREVYDEARAKYADAVHPADCVRCGPSGKPALAGSPLSAGHQHARALRVVAKTVLRDLWREAKRLHEEEHSGH